MELEKTAIQAACTLSSRREFQLSSEGKSNCRQSPDLDDEVDRREKANEKSSSLERGILSLRDLAEIALQKQPGTQRLLLVVDQWEELYTLCRDVGVIRSFVDQ